MGRFRTMKEQNEKKQNVSSCHYLEVEFVKSFTSRAKKCCDCLPSLPQTDYTIYNSIQYNTSIQSREREENTGNNC